ncbi:3,4-dihydroxy 2-butanone 4-phosphate synthase [Phytophthora boehmeriae]|uniref:3,4-dihydroxy-2-butanone-4-phosphate synthase n=1 Tax=Phytophthora boehmeriae TaxID=109152 RepID=A0A8T1V3G9_9STRA|nr:3,4-dihydroxy 2-butanone 4-phosphate synthase [Phytophthora boehmeriae]
MDNEDRENEGDLIAAAEFATEESVAFMLRHSTGIVCVPALPERIQELQLPLMVEHNTEAHKCKFTVTVDLKEGNTTGVSAADRARTIRALADPSVAPEAFNRPGHIFPLLAQSGGVMRTEASVKSGKVSTPLGDFASVEYKSLVQEDQTYHALVYGDVSGQSDVPVFLVEDGFEAGLQAQWAQQQIARHGAGVLIYIHGSAQLLQISGELMARQSIFGMAMQIVRDLKIDSVRLLSTTESSFDLNGFGVEIAGSERLITSA